MDRDTVEPRIDSFPGDATDREIELAVSFLEDALADPRVARA
ncbi:hypothetical protein MBEHAL_0169 [Halarchaeum acidiphilum MH1-52-1]|uniref:Uncharacterized protein n=1 Tax=Halarchaeum acidiphilum MH1-52-1 TaxID=1261545 RepID=U3A1A3_9EURY|nr:hypothetical protein [Halarchaeum acidiphilum]GAD51409.1 hypothetical protein MBEHAL_0169 [Halarchaeum acidiphilum MH1-52-1]